jgi:nucleolar protein 15
VETAGGKKNGSSVVYLGHIPWGFFEEQIKGFFSQFGDIVRLKLSRSKKVSAAPLACAAEALTACTQTGNSKGYAFIEFEHPDVAEVAASTMDKYMMFGRTLVCRVVPADKVRTGRCAQWLRKPHATACLQIHPQTFKGAGRRFRKVPWKRIARERHNRVRTPDEQKERVRRLKARENKRRRTLNEKLGVDYDFPGYVSDAELCSGGGWANAMRVGTGGR